MSQDKKPETGPFEQKIWREINKRLKDVKDPALREAIADTLYEKICANSSNILNGKKIEDVIQESLQDILGPLNNPTNAASPRPPKAAPPPPSTKLPTPRSGGK